MISAWCTHHQQIERFDITKPPAHEPERRNPPALAGVRTAAGQRGESANQQDAGTDNEERPCIEGSRSAGSTPVGPAARSIVDGKRYEHKGLPGLEA